MPICFPRGIRPESFKEKDAGLLSAYSSVIFFSYSLDETSQLCEWLQNNKSEDLELLDLKNNPYLSNFLLKRC